MNVELNRDRVAVGDDCKTLLQLLENEKLVRPGVAVAVNNRVVPRTLWAETPLTEGMKVTVIQAVCGG
ncbi:MAG: sulfur carrier protein ThiS [Muribaculaceae bacterium]|nr:sulfur carrier protein ThiS [Muribaculaceae bacterium]MDE6331568.1 sulfur carrier protein ThiS [Muribaculaceae bacterium]